MSSVPPQPESAPAAGRRWPLGPPFGRLLLAWIGLVYVLALAILGTGSLAGRNWGVERLLFWREDAPVLVACVALTAAFGLVPAGLLARAKWPSDRAAPAWVAALSVACLISGWIGWRLVFGGYAFSLDEFLARFDAQIFASGRLMAPVTPAWRPYVPALQPIFMLPLPNDVWVSSYLPVNAALRALGRLAHAESLVNPLLSAFSVVAVWRVGRLLWPERPSLAFIAAALLGTSPQLIVMSMSAYAMPAHLALNLAWLWLFLSGKRLGHAGAIGVGFFATGIHQLIFHPAFVAPFVLQLWVRRRWGLAALYTVAYAAICLFWIEYWPLAAFASGVQPVQSHGTGGAYLVDRVAGVLAYADWRNLGVFAENIVRFATWQNVLVAPLALLGAIASIRTKGYIRPLVLGVLLTLALVFVATPSQTHGWGYRYLHGLLGSTALAAAWGWAQLTDALTAERKAAAAGALLLASIVSVLVLTPLRAWQAWSYVRPYAAAYAAVQGANADVVVVDNIGSALFEQGALVRNDPFLGNRPKVMELLPLTGPGMRALCATKKVLVFNDASARAWGVPTAPWDGDPHTAELRQLMISLGCYRVMLPSA